MSLFPDTRFNDWTQQDLSSFTKRYFEPLWRSALWDFRWIDTSRAQDLAQAFLLRELERTPIFEQYEPLKGHNAKFRTYLRTCFYRFARDELAKERRRGGLSRDALPVELPAASFKEFDRLVTRDLLRNLRERIVASPPMAPEAQQYFDLKWPPITVDEPPADAEIAETLNLSRAKLRTIKRKVADRILLAIRRQVHSEGLRGRDADGVLEGYLSILAESA